jgi:class 3 adenylate cyclase/tetratricopeptide (TPR) repeat protein
MLRCPSCQTMNPPQAKFCFECGQRLLICPHCGTANLAIARFCIECGRPLAAGGHRPTDVAGQESRESAPRSLEGATSATVSSAQTQPAVLALPAPARARQTQPLTQELRQSEEERRIVTIMFADLTGSTPLAEKLDPEEMRAILASYFNLMARQIRRHGGTVEKYIGDAVMAVFGIPIAHEDDPDRAIRAALDMQQALERFNQHRRARDPDAVTLHMRIGLNTGEVAAPGSEPLSRHDFLVTGDAVNVAARLQQAALPDTILVGERTYLATRDVFNFRPTSPLHLKGKPEPIRAWTVLGLAEGQPPIAPHPRGISGLTAPLIGRTLELTLMHATYARVQAEQQPHLITLLGPPGIGKSRLVRDFIAREQEKARYTSDAQQRPAPLVMRGRCPPYGEGITYWPLIETLRTLLHVQYNESDEEIQQRFTAFVSELLRRANRKEEAQEVAEAILRSVGRELSNEMPLGSLERRERERQRMSHTRNLDQGGSQMTLLRSWRIFMEALSQQQPLILVIDDLQWADEALLDLLEHLMERLNNVPILFICPARPEFLERRHSWGGGQRNFTTILLEALSKEESAELVRALLKNAELPEALCHTIQARAEGNPFFVEEIIRMLIDQGVLVYEDGCWRLGRQKESLLGDLASPAGPPDDTLLDLHYTLPLPYLPDTIQGVLAARIDLLAPAEKRVLQEAAIIGRTFWLSALHELMAELSEEMLLEILESLMQRDFIFESERSDRSPVENDRVFSFKHILIRDVVYNGLSRIRRAQEHARLAIWLEEQVRGRSDRFVELLAYHYQQAVVIWPRGLVTGLSAPRQDLAMTERGEPMQLSLEELRRRAVTYLLSAGDQALHSYYTIRAIQAYSEALELLSESGADPATLATMHEKLGDAFTQRANLKEAWQEYRQALQLLKTLPATEHDRLLYLYDSLAELATRLGPWYAAHPDMQEVRAYIDAGLELAEDQGDRAVFLTYLAMWYMSQPARDTDERAQMGEQALQSGREALRMAEEAGDLDALWLTLDALSAIYMKQHKYVEAHESQHRRQELVERIMQQMGSQDRQELHDLYYSLGWVHFFISDYPTAVRWFGESWHIAQTMESPSHLLISMLGRMEVWFHWERWDDAYDVAQKVLSMVEQYQLEELWEMQALENLALIAYRRGENEQGERFLRRYKLLVEETDDLHWRSEQELAALLAREEWSAAFAILKELVEQSEPFPRPDSLTLLAELAIATEQPAELQRELCERALGRARQAGARKAMAEALRACGWFHLQRQEWEAALQDLREALQICKQLDLPWQRGQTLFRLGEVYRRRAEAEQGPARAHDLERARFNFEQALGFFEALHAVRDAGRTRLALNGDVKTPI